MESLCGSSVLPGRIEAPPARHLTRSSRDKAPTLRSWCGGNREKIASLMLSSPQRRGRRWRVLAHEASGLNALIDNGLPLFENDLVTDGGHESCMSEKMERVTPVSVGNGRTGSKSGLFRAPISGGVQSATFVHDLARPALAVRNLMEQAKFGQLCTIMSRIHHHRAGYPVGSLVDFVPDSMGRKSNFFALFTGNPHKESLGKFKMLLVVQIPGWSSLSNARVTVFGDVFPLAADQQECAREQFVAKHQQWASQQWGNFTYYRMQSVNDVYFIGGFGTVAWVDVKEYEALKPDKIAADSVEQNLKELNAIFSKPMKDILSIDAEIDAAAFISVDSKGTDVWVRQGAQFTVQRISFEVEHEVQTLDDVKAALEKIINRHCRSKFQNGS